MQRISLNESNLSLSRLIYGVWRLADDPDPSIKQVRAKIDTALAEGITTFDHADIYGNYDCEQLFGRALALDSGLRPQMELISKCDICLNTDKFPARRVKYYDTSAAYINASVELSLEKLHTDYLDCLLIHRPDPLMNAAETGAALDALIDSGKIRSAGVSNFHAPEWRLLQSHMRHPLVVNQVEMSILCQDAFLNGDLSNIQTDGLAALAWSPLAGGRLFGDEAAAQRVRPLLAKLAAEQNTRVDLVAFAWLLAHPANILPVVGTNNLGRIQGLAEALAINIERETWFEIWIAASGNELP
ncbi:aldo/keto reductase [Reinekea sp.]|jgi:predicted oxidoreductase|uniref:aldo/keto reductase n=1 Tax=Reinekea sp. TaxID=1970455 RepID=UPI002A82E8DF|nr:aldo/keto reductase [Reinekea sp.]